MVFTLILTIATSACLGMAFALYHRTRSFAFVLGIAVLYFWTIHGAWSIVNDILGGDSGKRYHYLFDKMVPVYLDETYAESLLIYLLFISTVALAAFISVKPNRHLTSSNSAPVHICHWTIFTSAAVAGIMSCFLVKGQLSQAVSLGISGYHALDSNENAFFTIHQVLNRMALLPLAIGIATYASGEKGILIRGSRTALALLGYIVASIGMTLFCYIIGAKNELFHALLTGTLFYLHNTLRPKLIKLGASCLLMFGIIAYIDTIRSKAIDSIGSTVSWHGYFESFAEIFNSNEAFASHISLYAARIRDVSFTYGSSILSLISSVIPRLFWSDRPSDIYSHYVQGINAVEGQGYTIHHATGWYLNFGLIGIIIGGALLGYVWAKLFNAQHNFNKQTGGTLHRIFYAVAFFTFTGGLQILVRAGPEAYKSIIINCFLAPIIVLYLAARQKHQSTKLIRQYKHFPVNKPHGQLKLSLGL